MSLFQAKKAPALLDERMFSLKDMLKIAAPLIIQQILGVTAGAVDTMMVSYAGDAAVSGVSLVNSLDTFLILFFNSLVTGGAVVISQTLGRKSYEEGREVSKQLLYIAPAMAPVISLLSFAFRKPLLSMLFGSAEADVMYHAEWYFFIILFSFPFVAVEGSVIAIFRSAGNSVIGMLVTMIANVLNVIGNAILIIGLDMGAMGAAISTVGARVFSGCVLLVLIHNKKHVIYLEKLLHYKPDFHIIRRILHIGVPSGIEGGMFHFGKLMTQSLISTMGTAVIAANAVALTVSQYQYITGTAYSNTSYTVVGQCVGAGNKREAKRCARTLLFFNYLTIWVVILATVIFINPILSLFNTSPESAEVARSLLLYHSICAALIWPLGFMLPAIFRAASDVRFPLITSLTSMWVFRVALSYVLALDSISVFGWFTLPGLGMGVMGVWVAMTVDWVCRSTLYVIRFFSGRWMRKRSLQ